MGNTTAAQRNGTSSDPNVVDLSHSTLWYDQSNINRGTPQRPRPMLKFHSVHGTNIQLLKEDRVARRRESFCKGLVFSSRPIGIDEIVCIRLCEVGTNWSGVLRLGVTNVDPASFRDIELPKFACPDLTSKSGYWAKALAERYSVQKAILHFHVNAIGEMHYGINGVNKGLFLNGINTLEPLWIVIDIYGNSIGVEFLEPGEIPTRDRMVDTTRSPHAPETQRPTAPERRNPRTSPPPRPSPPVISYREEAVQIGSDFPIAALRHQAETSHDSLTSIRPADSSALNNTLLPARLSGNSMGARSDSNPPRLRFHTVTGANVTLQSDDTVAARKQGEYYLGYVFTDRPLSVGEQLTILDPIQVPASRLPMDSDELLERPEYWVCMKDVAALPTVGDRLSFLVDTEGQVVFKKNGGPGRVIMHVDVSIPLWAFFDLYGTTRKVQLVDRIRAEETNEELRSYRASSEGVVGSSSVIPSSSLQQRATRPASTAFNLDAFRVALPPTQAISSTLQAGNTAASHSSENLPISQVSHGAFTISPASSSSSGAPMGGDSLDLARLRASIARRLSPYEGRASTGSSADGGGGSVTIATTAGDGGELSPFLAARRSRQTTAATAGSLPSSLLGSSPRLTRHIALDESLGSHHHHRYEGASASTLTATLLPDSSSISQRSRDGAEKKPSPVNAQNSGEVSDENAQENYNECSICMNSRVNAVIYRCGHMCMCFKCAKETHRRSGDCPICRTPIIDVIRCYPV